MEPKKKIKPGKNQERLADDIQEYSKKSPIEQQARPQLSLQSQSQSTLNPPTTPKPKHRSAINSPSTGGKTYHLSPQGKKVYHPNDNSVSQPALPAGSPTMSSQRNRQARGGPRGAANGRSEEMDLWDDIRSILTGLKRGEAKAEALNQQIIEAEEAMAQKKLAGIKPSLKEIDDLSQLYRDQVRDSEQQKTDQEEVESKITLLKALQSANESVAETQLTARASSSRGAGMGDFDGPSDSPIPSPADNKQVRKVGPSRTSSQPPRSATEPQADSAISESGERATKPKIVYAKGEEVAFKRKIAGKTEEQDWIWGKVVRVIGEGKSRRYEVEDLYPEEGIATTLYKSSASQMAPIPPEGSNLEDFEVGKRVLALYPETTTFYRAEVKAMVNNGAGVELLFEEEPLEKLKIVERRWVLDHKG